MKYSELNTNHDLFDHEILLQMESTTKSENGESRNLSLKKGLHFFLYSSWNSLNTWQESCKMFSMQHRYIWKGNCGYILWYDRPIYGPRATEWFFHHLGNHSKTIQDVRDWARLRASVLGRKKFLGARLGSFSAAVSAMLLRLLRLHAVVHKWWKRFSKRIISFISRVYYVVLFPSVRNVPINYGYISSWK